jgi:hypothetical protein
MFNLVVLCNEGDTANFLLFVCIQTTFLQEQSNGGWLSHAYKKINLFISAGDCALH